MRKTGVIFVRGHLMHPVLGFYPPYSPIFFYHAERETFSAVKLLD